MVVIEFGLLAASFSINLFIFWQNMIMLLIKLLDLSMVRNSKGAISIDSLKHNICNHVGIAYMYSYVITNAWVMLCL